MNSEKVGDKALEEYRSWLEDTSRYIIRPEYSHGWRKGTFKLTHFPNKPTYTHAKHLEAYVCDLNNTFYVKDGNEFIPAKKEDLLNPVNFHLRELYTQALDKYRIEEKTHGKNE